MVNISNYIKKLENSPYGKINNIDVAKEDLRILLCKTVETYCTRLSYNYLWISEDNVILDDFLKEEAIEAEFILKVRLDNVYENFMSNDIKEYVRGY